jgi:hypothetical protein
VVLLVLLAACSGKDNRTVSTTTNTSAEGSSTMDTDAATLGNEIYGLVDQAMGYKSAHRGRLPRSLRELGVDELTRATSRTLSASGGEPSVQVEFRNLESHSLRSCRGTSAILEEASISGGEFTLICTTTTGGSTTLKARR